MNKKLYLMWNSYNLNRLLTIGVIEELQKNEGYAFKFNREAEIARSELCVLPFPYTEECLYFDSLPSFFQQRIIKSPFALQKFGLNKSNLTDFEKLTLYESIKTSDNYMILDEKKYLEVKNNINIKKK